jgi:hypothetical protein
MVEKLPMHWMSSSSRALEAMRIGIDIERRSFSEERLWKRKTREEAVCSDWAQK